MSPAAQPGNDGRDEKQRLLLPLYTEPRAHPGGAGQLLEQLLLTIKGRKLKPEGPQFDNCPLSSAPGSTEPPAAPPSCKRGDMSPSSTCTGWAAWGLLAK